MKIKLIKTIVNKLRKHRKLVLFIKYSFILSIIDEITGRRKVLLAKKR
ncbi:MAG: hypothetical protein LBT18_01100 [Endomicrobium sp.]|jgi:hypothetical protein|nr:hypothetical protein [Endomicrobium sp.]